MTPKRASYTKLNSLQRTPTARSAHLLSFEWGLMPKLWQTPISWRVMASGASISWSSRCVNQLYLSALFCLFFTCICASVDAGKGATGACQHRIAKFIGGRGFHQYFRDSSEGQQCLVKRHSWRRMDSHGALSHRESHPEGHETANELFPLGHREVGDLGGFCWAVPTLLLFQCAVSPFSLLSEIEFGLQFCVCIFDSTEQRGRRDSGATKRNLLRARPNI